MSLESYMKLENKDAVLAELRSTEKDIQEQVIENLGKAGKEVRNQLRDSLPAAPGPGAASAAGGVPYSQTGELKRTIGSRVMPLKLGEPVTLSVHVTKRGFYGRMLEFGTSKMAARPWFFSGIMRLFPFLTGAVAAAVPGVVERKNRRLGSK